VTRGRDADAAMLDSLGRKLQELAALLRGEDLSDEDALRLGVLARRVFGLVTGEPEPHSSDEANARRRELLLALCQAGGRLVRHTGDAADTYAASAAEEYGIREPAERALARTNLPLIRALIEAHGKNTGGRGRKGKDAVNEAIETLCDAMGYPANAKTIERTRQRRTARTKPPR